MRYLALVVITAWALLCHESASAEDAKLRVFTGSTAHWADLIVAMKKGFF
jgi:hypothetical protein